MAEVGGKGLFVKELEQAMLDGRADIAVHSVKDLPAQMPPGFSLPVLAYRADVRDVLLNPGGPIEALPQGAKVGSSSLRRKSQLLAHRPDLEVLPVRGNVGTRLGKLDAGEFDAMVLAAAGLQRLEIVRDDMHPISVDDCLPAPGQGALGIECREDDEILSLLAPLRDPDVERCVAAERGISAGLGADCSLPVAAYAQLSESGEIELRALLSNADGTQILRSSQRGADPEEVSRRAVDDLYAQGAQAVLAGLRA